MRSWTTIHLVKARLAAAVAASLAIMLLAGCAQSATAPSMAAEPTATPAPTTYASDRYGYSISIPAEWIALERPGDLRLRGLRPRHPGTDTLGPPESHEFDILDGIVVVGARELAPGETLDRFTEEASAATVCGPHGRDTASLGGEPAEVRKFECGGTRWHQFTAVHDGRGYLVWVTRPLAPGFAATFSFTD